MTLDVGGAFLSAFLQVLFQKLASQEWLNYYLFDWWEIKEPLMKLASTASKIKALLEDAVEKQVKDVAVRMWLDDLHDLVGDAENLLEDVEYEALRRQAEAGSETGSNFLAVVSSSANELVFKGSIVSRVTKITERLEDIAEQRAKLELVVREEVLKVRSSGSTTTSLVEDCILGRENDVNNILELLVGNGDGDGDGDESVAAVIPDVDEPVAIIPIVDHDDDEPVAVIPIVGLGGVGKTTVAQVLYNDKKVGSHFKVRAWAFVSDDFDLVKITRGILESLGEFCDYKNLEPLQCRLREILSDKKYLLVLDDVWSEDYDQWEVLLRPLRAGPKGSKVIVTTRNEKVAQTVRTTTDIPICHLKELTDDDCWSLFAIHANFANVTSGLRNKFEKIGKKIVNKCKGLPLAVKALGGLLRSRLDIDEWQDVANNKIWDSSEQRQGILPALSLSYHHLPSHLKLCFAYCSIFPKGHEFEEEGLVNLWIAQGFVQQPAGGNKQMEDLGRKYFRELLSRSLFQYSSGRSANSRFLMHDLINDLAQFVAGESCFRLEDKDCSHSMICSNTRHFSFIRRRRDISTKFEALNLSKLRTFLPLDGGFGNCHLTDGVTDDLLPKCESLRILSLSHYTIAELPSSIGKLKHLGYLDLSHTAIEKLPDSTATLYHLRTLILYGCIFLNELPADLRNLSNLRHFNIRETGLKMLPLQMGRLKNLRTLPCFIIGKSGGSGIQELRDLDNLQGELSIIGLQNVKSPEEAKSTDLKHKQYLNEITLAWDSSAGGLQPDTLAMNVLDMLEPHVSIKSLSISDYGGAKLSSWLGDPLFDNIVSVVISNCKKCTALPPLGQLPSLKDLTIEGMDGVESVGHEFYTDGFCFAVSFQSLQTLKFHNMLVWKEWSSTGAGEGCGFPCLHELYLHNCPVLSGEVPDLPSLTVIEIRNCKELQVLPRLLMLQKIVLEECHEAILRSIVSLTSVEELQIRRFLNLDRLPEGLLGSLNALRALEVIGCDKITTLSNQVSLSCHTSLRRIAISNCPLISTLAEEENGLPRTIEHLEIRSCRNLEDNPRGLQDLMSLAELRITGCPRLQSFSLNGSLLRLRRLEIKDCEALQSLPEGLMHSENVSFEFLEIDNCSSLVSFPVGELPTNLKELKILGCSNLATLPDGLLQRSPSLECLHIHGCPFTSFPETNNPSSLSASTSSSSHSISTFFSKLKEFKLQNCSDFVSFPHNLHNFTHLNKLSISNCPKFESFPQRGLPSKLTSLSILECKNLRSLPSRMHLHTSLEELTIDDCPLLDSFPGLGLPTSLKSLQISNCSRLPFLCKWELDKLKMLRNYVLDNSSPSSGLP